MNKTLCKPCAIKLAETHTMKERPARDVKITCEACGRRRYGCAYEVSKKEVQNVNVIRAGAQGAPVPATPH